MEFREHLDWFVSALQVKHLQEELLSDLEEARKILLQQDLQQLIWVGIRKNYEYCKNWGKCRTNS